MEQNASQREQWSGDGDSGGGLEGDELIAACRHEALALLLENSSEHGIMAAGRGRRAELRRYTRIFARDASICAIAMALFDGALRDGARRTLLTLASRQAPNGQIPNYVDAEGGKEEADFWYLGCIDATLWWLIAVAIYARHAGDGDFPARLARPLAKAIDWLHCQEHQSLHLVQQNEVSDWADIMPRTGFVLYSNALWHYVKLLYRLPQRQETWRHCNQLFFPYAGEESAYRRVKLLAQYARRHEPRMDSKAAAAAGKMYLSFVSLGQCGEEGDLFGNLLALLCGLAEGERAAGILDAVAQAQEGAPYPLRAVARPIGREESGWRDYMARHGLNLPHQYHNGGIWPLIGGFWVLALARAGRQAAARQELRRLAQANAQNGWQFNEWLHGLSGEPMGMPRQSWNAAAFLLADVALAAGKPVFGVAGETAL